MSTLLFLSQETASTQQCRIVSIQGSGGPQEQKFLIDPEVLSIAKGDCVVWVSWARGEEVKVTFAEGKKCSELTESPVEFKMNVSDECYVTSWIPLGGTSSLRFKEAGKFDYVVKSKKTKYQAKGSIVVK